MLPFDQKPWARTVAAVVITLSFIGAVALGFYFYDKGELHISEVVGIFLLLLTIVPPNLAVILRKSCPEATAGGTLGHTGSTAL